LSLRDLGVWEPWFYLGATLCGVNGACPLIEEVA
jgi:hypothetical protein